MPTVRKASLRTLLTHLAMALPLAAFAGEVEVLHFWTSGGEAAAMEVLMDKVRESGHVWKDFTVAGGAGGNARKALAERVLIQDPPTTTIIKGDSIRTWAKLKYLANLDDIAVAEEWDTHLPPVIADIMKYEGHYVATPVNVHRTNWMWVNKAILDEVGGTVPTTWEEFESLAVRIQDAGYSVIAHGDQPWQDATLFEAVALGIGGAEFYRRAFVKHEREALRSDTMTRVFEQMSRLRPYLSTDLQGDEWNTATSAVINGEAAFQFMGDWAKGEFQLAGMQPGQDYLCAPAPGTNGMFIFNIDSFAMFQMNHANDTEAQQALAHAIMDEHFQSAFNRAKGSIPARTDISMDGFDECAKHSREDFLIASQRGTLVPSIAHGMATTEQIAGEFTARIAEVWSATNMTPRDAMKEVAKAIRYGMYLMV